MTRRTDLFWRSRLRPLIAILVFLIFVHTGQTTSAAVTPLTSGQITPTQSIAPHMAQIFSAHQTGANGNYVSVTKDWVTQCDMIVMYSGSTCGSKLPDINDYNAIIADITTGGGSLYQTTGKIINGYRFYYALAGLNQSLSLTGTSGCYYVFMYNRSAIPGLYALRFVDTDGSSGGGCTYNIAATGPTDLWLVRRKREL